MYDSAKMSDRLGESDLDTAPLNLLALQGNGPGRLGSISDFG